MTLFEYLSVATSLVLSISAAQLITNLRAVLLPARRYWVHTLWVGLALFGLLIIWWEFWGYRDVESWNLAQFVLMLLNPGILLFCASALVTPDLDSVVPWEQHFFDVRRPFFAAFGMLPIVSVVRRWALADLPIFSSQNLPELLFVCLCAVGVSSARRDVHGSLVIAYWLALITTSAHTWFRPGAVVS